MPKILKKQCTAQSKQSGKRCKRLPAIDREVCSMHGGKSPKGFASGTYRHGHRSKYLKHLPPSLQPDFEASVEESDVPSVSEELGLTRLHLKQVVEMLNDSTLFDNWQAIRRSVEQLEEIVLNPPEFDEEQGLGFEQTPEMIFQTIRELFTKNAAAIKTWSLVHELDERIRKMEETNSKLRLANLEEETERNELVPVGMFKIFVLECGRQFELSPDEIRKQQMVGLQSAFDALPPAVRQPKQLTA